ncbi:hypothetical protein [Arenimonas sp.]|uniref:hypothetical protein n=1 Tax=Arenimonas sp. TaxID=1872635 RepID=UPI0039E69FC4
MFDGLQHAVPFLMFGAARANASRHILAALRNRARRAAAISRKIFSLDAGKNRWNLCQHLLRETGRNMGKNRLSRFATAPDRAPPTQPQVSHVATSAG